MTGSRLGEELSRLLEELTGNPGASHSSGAGTSPSAPSAAPAPDCQGCPLCRGITSLRAEQPEVAALVAAVLDRAGTLLRGVARDLGAGAEGPRPGPAGHDGSAGADSPRRLPVEPVHVRE